MRRNIKRFSVVAAVLSIAAAGALQGCGGGDDDATTATDPTLVTTDKGAVQGVSNATTITFMGIPFAASTAGANRFKAPQPRAAWATALQANAPGPDCLQSARGSNTVVGSEDCLYLNVTVPKSTAANKPVLMMIHGGGFRAGRGASYDGTWLADAGNVITVTVNYRLGILGWLAHGSLDNGTGNTGNYGLQDQQAALRWIKTNIAAFGGDPNNVTLGGMSAGAMSTCLQAASPQAQGLFAKIIVESGPCAFNWETLEEKLAAEFAVPAALGCTGTPDAVATCLRSADLNLASLITVQNTTPQVLGAFSPPSVGGYDVPAQPRTALGKFPTLLGFVVLERGRNTQPADDASYLATLTSVYGATLAPLIQAAYPATGTYPAGATAYGAARSDYDVTPGATELAACLNSRSYQIAVATGGKPIYGWEFRDVAAGNFTHVSHEKYLYPLFSDTYPPTGTALGASSQALSNTMVKYWANFVSNGDPNSAGLPTWPAYSGPTTVMQLDAMGVGTGLDIDAEHNCGFWRSVGRAL